MQKKKRAPGQHAYA